MDRVVRENLINDILHRFWNRVELRIKKKTEMNLQSEQKGHVHWYVCS